MNPFRSLPRAAVSPLLKSKTRADIQAPPTVDRQSLILMTLIVLLGTALGASGLNKDIIWLDEIFSLSNMGAFNPPYSPQDVVASLNQYSPDHVPLYFVLGSQWAQLVGWTQLPMRYLALLLGALLIAALFGFAREALGRRTALLAAFLLSANAFVILYFHEVRMYTLLLLLAVVHSWVYWRLTNGTRARRCTWLLFVLTGIAVAYTHVFAFYFLAGLALQHLAFMPKTRRWLAIVGGWLLVLLAFLPYLTIFSRGFFGVTTSVDTLSKALTAPELALSVAHVLVNDMVILWAPIAVLTGLALRRPQRAFLRLLSVFAGMMLTLVVLNGLFQVIGINRMRYFLLAMPFFVIVVAYLLLSIRRWRIVAALFVLSWVAGGYRIHLLAERWEYAGHQTLLMAHPPLQHIADALNNATRPQDFVFGIAGSPVVSWRLKHGWTKADYYTQVVLGIDGAFVNGRLRGDELRADIERKLDDNPYLLFTYNPQRKHEVFDVVFGAIQAGYKPCEVVVDQADMFVQRYVYPSLACDRKYQPIHYENGIRIVDKFADYNSVRDALSVVTGWEVADEAQLDEYNISIQIITPDWQNVRQAYDRHLHDDILKWYVEDIPTTGLPAGDYRVVVILYDRNRSSAKASGVDLTSGEAGTILPILHFTIEEREA